MEFLTKFMNQCGLISEGGIFVYSFEKGQRSMNPYVAGSLAGLIIILSVVFTGKFVGASITYARIAEKLLNWLSPAHSAGLVSFNASSLLFGWEPLFLGGILIGSLISSTVNGTFFIEAVPGLWRARFGSGSLLRMSIAFIGGVLIAFGARMAGGGFLTHGLGGVIQLSAGSLVSLFSFCAGGMIIARFIYGRS